MSVLMRVVEILRYTSFGVFLLFGVMYHAMTRGTWRRRPEGVWLMCLVGLIMEFVGLAVAATAFGPEYWGRVWFQLFVWVQLALLPVGLVALLLRAQRMAWQAREAREARAASHPRTD